MNMNAQTCGREEMRKIFCSLILLFSFVKKKQQKSIAKSQTSPRKKK